MYRARGEQFARVAWAITGDRELAWDALQDGFARALISVQSYRSESRLDAWVARIVVNAAHDILRKRRREIPTADDNPPSPAGEPPSMPGLQRAIGRLPERQRLAIFLRYYADLDYSQIAEVLGVERGTVGATLNAAHRSLTLAAIQEVQ
ncbi:MAG TPA: sigma-70 family RNA polymerase sigma factor [Gaiellaceae bacterium]